MSGTRAPELFERLERVVGKRLPRAQRDCRA